LCPAKIIEKISRPEKDLVFLSLKNPYHRLHSARNFEKVCHGLAQEFSGTENQNKQDLILLLSTRFLKSKNLPTQVRHSCRMFQNPFYC